MPKVQGLQRQEAQHTHTPSLRALFLETCATAYMRDHADSAGGGVTGEWFKFFTRPCALPLQGSKLPRLFAPCPIISSQRSDTVIIALSLPQKRWKSSPPAPTNVFSFENKNLIYTQVKMRSLE